MAAAKAFPIGGIGAQPSLEDVLKIAQGAPVALDTAGADRIKKESPPPKSFQAEAFSAEQVSSPAAPHLTELQTRATIATRLLSVMAGKSAVRLQVRLQQYLSPTITLAMASILTCGNS